MPVTVTVREVGTFTKLADKTTIPGDLPRRLNTRADLYGRLDEPLDLTLGFENYKDEGMGDKFQSMFDYLKKTSKPGTSLEEVVGADFVSNRRNLHIFARSPYEKDKKMQEIQAIKKNGVIFLCDKAEDVEDTSLLYGYKFEKYMTLSEEGYTRSKYEKVSNATCSKAVSFDGNTPWSEVQDRIRKYLNTIANHKDYDLTDRHKDLLNIPQACPLRTALDTQDLYGRLDEPMDLTLGFEDYKDEGMGDKFQSLFDYLKKTSKPETSLEEVVSADFVSNRRNLHVFARSPYRKDKMEIQAIKKNGVIFLCEKAEDVEDTSLPYGYKFEQYMTLSEEGHTRSKYERVSHATCSKALFRTSIDSGKETIKVFYAAEIDAIDRAENFVKLKTTCNKYHKWLHKNSLNEYLQSYLGNIKYIIRGTTLNWNEPIVYKTEKVWTHVIPKMPVTWNKDTCFEALFRILQKIKSKLEYDDEALVVRIERGEEITFEPECSKNCTFLKPEYFAHFE